MATTAKVFMSGRSQAVRLPKEFRFDVDEVLIERRPDGILLRTKSRMELLNEFLAARVEIEGDDDFLIDRFAGLKEDVRPDPLFPDDEALMTIKHSASANRAKSSKKNKTTAVTRKTRE